MSNQQKHGWPWTGAVDPTVYKLRTNWPKISIVTPSFNQGHFIEETILSILNQNYPNLEYIIIDAGSTDITIEVIKKYEDRINYFVSEKDKGQSDAINKGLKLCTGNIFNWINSDDLLAPNSLFLVASNFDFDATDILAGAVLNDFSNHKNSSQLFFNKDLDISKILKVEVPPFYYHQPGIWFKKENLDRLPDFDVNMHYYFDWEFTLKYLSQYPSIVYIEDVLVWFRLHDNSKTIAVQKKYDAEILQCYEHLSCFLNDKHHLYKKAVKKYQSLLWHTDILNKTKREGYNFEVFKYIAINTLLKPKYRLTRLTMGQLRKFFFFD